MMKMCTIMKILHLKISDNNSEIVDYSMFRDKVTINLNFNSNMFLLAYTKSKSFKAILIKFGKCS